MYLFSNVPFENTPYPFSQTKVPEKTNCGLQGIFHDFLRKKCCLDFLFLGIEIKKGQAPGYYKNPVTDHPTDPNELHSETSSPRRSQVAAPPMVAKCKAVRPSEESARSTSNKRSTTSRPGGKHAANGRLVGKMGLCVCVDEIYVYIKIDRQTDRQTDR